HAVSWTFAAPANEESTAILIANGTPQALKVAAYNLSQSAVKANLKAWDREPGTWELVQGFDGNGDDIIDGVATTTTVELERSTTIEVMFQPRVTTIINLKLVAKGTPLWERPDLGISRDDVVVRGTSISLTVHSLGAKDSQAVTAALVNQNGKVLKTAVVPKLEAPLDLRPRRTTVMLAVPPGTQLAGCNIVLDGD